MPYYLEERILLHGGYVASARAEELPGLNDDLRVLYVNTPSRMVSGDQPVSSNGMLDAKSSRAQSGDHHQPAVVATEREHLAESSLRALRDPILILGTDFRVQMASDAFYHTFHMTPTETENRSFFALGGGQWDIPRLRQLLEDIPGRNGYFNDFEVTEDIPGVGRRTMLLYGKQLLDERLQQGILLGIQDITDVPQFQAATRQDPLALGRSEANFRDFLEDASVPIHWVGPVGTILRANRAALDLLGYSQEEYCGHSIAEFHADLSVEDFLARLTSGEKVTDYEARLRCKDGSLRHVRISSNAFFEHGHFVHNCCFTRDITERKVNEAARARLTAIVESSDDAIVSKDLNGIISTWNAGAERLFGYTAEEAIGQPVTLFIPPDRQDEEVGILERIRRGEPIKHYETMRLHKDGRLVDVSLTVSPMADSRGRIVGASKIARDITERKKAEKALRNAQAQLADRALQLENVVSDRTAELTASNKQLEAFAYSVAHDLRAPLRWMEAFSAMLMEEEEGLSDRGKEFIGRINRSAQFMDALLRDLLTFSVVTQQRIELGSVHMEAVVKTVLTRLEMEIEEQKARIDCPGPWPTVLAHAPTLGQVLFNLLNNALKFSANGVPVVIRVHAEERLGPPSETFPGQNGPATIPDPPRWWVRIWVEDNGIGIAPGHENQIFRLFTRLNGEKYSGTGLGLAIVRRGVERMGGSVGVASSLGQGSRFWFELPRA